MDSPTDLDSQTGQHFQFAFSFVINIENIMW